MRTVLKFSFIIFSILFSLNIKAQNNVGIGTNNPDINSILELSSTTKGLLIPRLTTLQRTAMNPSLSTTQTGLLVFDTNDNVFYFWNGTAWTQIGAGSAGCTTLENAYNCGGNGAGRIINANYGPFEINASTAATNAIKITHSNSGVAINASSTLASNAYSTIQSTTISTNSLVSAILGNSSGAGFGVSGQIASTGTSQAAVYGNNLRTNGGHGVWGFGFNGVVGETNYDAAFGVYGYNHGTTDPGVGTAGIGITGIAGQSTNLALSYGVFSFDDGGITGALDVGGNFSAGGTKAFRIQHPLKPNMFLKHFCIESPEVLNVYRGNVIIDNNGEALIILPDYFKSININFSYNLTSIGVAAPDLHVKNEVTENTFTIAGGKPGSKVSWTLYAERNDKYIQEHPESKEIEVIKNERDLKLLKGEKLTLLKNNYNNIQQPIIKVNEN
jgi:hypothetical protein